MQIIQNAFANTSSSLIISKVQGNIVDFLYPPLSPGEVTSAMLLGGTTRGLVVGFFSILVSILFIKVPIFSIFYIFIFALLGSLLLACIGFIAGLWADRFDNLAAVTNFIVIPLSFLSGTFYSIKSLPPIMADLTLFNPIFLLIDGVRYGCIGYSEGSIIFALAASLILCGGLIFLCTFWVSVGYKLKN